MDAPDSQRKKLVWEAILGFVSFFTLIALLQAVWNVVQDQPSVTPALILAILLVCLAGAWRGYSRYR